MVTLTIDNKQVSVPAGTTILDAARAVDIHIPTLCYLREINEVASCRVCAVEVEGVDKLATACNTLVEEGMVVHTNTQRVRLTRKTNVELIPARGPLRHLRAQRQLLPPGPVQGHEHPICPLPKRGH